MITFRRADKSDIELLSETRKKQMIDEGVQGDRNVDEELRQFFQRLGTSDLVQIIAEEDGKLVSTGAIYYIPFPPSFSNVSGIRGYIANMYTAPAYRGKGLATRILKGLKSDAKARGVKSMLLYAIEENRPFYEHEGFRSEDCWMELNKNT